MIDTKPKRTANHSAYKFVDKREEFTGSSLRGEAYTQGSAPHLSGRDTWMSEYETARYMGVRATVTYIVWSFATPIAYYSVAEGWYKVGQVFSSFSSRHVNGALRNVPGHVVTLYGSRGDWTVDCADCGTARHFTRRNDAERVYYPHR